MRKALLVGVATLALAVAGCNVGGGGSTAETAAQVVAAIQTACGYTTTAQQVEAVAIAIAQQSGVNPAAVTAAAITLEVANAVVNQVCAAVKLQTTNQLLSAAPKSNLGSDGSRQVIVNVQGVQVVGIWTPSK